jgi:hypothetical protein
MTDARLTTDDLKFVNGFPTPETAQKLYDELDYQRAVQVYLAGNGVAPSPSSITSNRCHRQGFVHPHITKPLCVKREFRGGSGRSSYACRRML